MLIYYLACVRVKNREAQYMDAASDDKDELRAYFEECKGKVIGLGKCINNMWVFDI